MGCRLGPVADAVTVSPFTVQEIDVAWLASNVGKNAPVWTPGARDVGGAGWGFATNSVQAYLVLRRLSAGRRRVVETKHGDELPGDVSTTPSENRQIGSLALPPQTPRASQVALTPIGT